MSVHREMRSDAPGDSTNWALDCGVAGCGTRFAAEVPMGVVGEHWNLEHAGKTFVAWQGDPATAVREASPNAPVPHLIWIGVGPPPDGRP